MWGTEEEDFVQGSGRAGIHSQGPLLTDHFFLNTEGRDGTNQTNLRNNNDNEFPTIATG